MRWHHLSMARLGSWTQRGAALFQLEVNGMVVARTKIFVAKIEAHPPSGGIDNIHAEDQFVKTFLSVILF